MGSSVIMAKLFSLIYIYIYIHTYTHKLAYFYRLPDDDLDFCCGNPCWSDFLWGKFLNSLCDRCPFSIVNKLCNYWFGVVILVKKSKTVVVTKRPPYCVWIIFHYYLLVFGCEARSELTSFTLTLIWNNYKNIWSIFKVESQRHLWKWIQFSWLSTFSR